MPDSPRLAELLRQRALLQEHLAWLEREIASCSQGLQTAAESLPPIDIPAPASGDAPSAASASVPGDAASAASVSTPGDAASAASASAPGAAASAASPSAAKVAAPLAQPSTAAANVEADTILAEHRTPLAKLQQDVRVGCFLYFAAALAATGAGVVVLYFLLRHR